MTDETHLGNQLSSPQALFLNDQQNFEQRPITFPSHLGFQEVQIQVKAFGINQADLMQRAGKYPAPKGYAQDLLGLEFSGVIEKLGTQVSAWQIGDRVMGIVASGAYSQVLVCHEDTLIKIPDHLSFEEAAAIPEVFLTAFDALKRGHIQPHQKILVHAVGSGVGQAISQIAQVYHAQVYGTSRQAWKLSTLSDQGLIKAGICLSDEEEIKNFEKTYDSSFDQVIDLVGAVYFQSNLKVLAYQGKMICVGLLSGQQASISMGLLLQKRLQIEGTVLRSRSLAEKIQLVQDFKKEILPALNCGQLKPCLAKSFKVGAIEMAHQTLKNHEIIGKITVSW
jgi:NADPH2:quinone reductase